MALKFYLCQTEDGPQFVHLLADAKKLDKGYETVEIDTAKQPLMDRLNDLMRRANAAEGERPIAVCRPPAQPGEIGTFKEGNVPAGDNQWHGNDHLVKSGQACNVCMTRRSIAAWRASTEASGEIEEMVQSLTEPIHIANIKELITDREKQLAEQGVAPVEATLGNPLPQPVKKQWGKKK